MPYHASCSLPTLCYWSYSKNNLQDEFEPSSKLQDHAPYYCSSRVATTSRPYNYPEIYKKGCSITKFRSPVSNVHESEPKNYNVSIHEEEK